MRIGYADAALPQRPAQHPDADEPPGEPAHSAVPAVTPAGSRLPRRLLPGIDPVEIQPIAALKGKLSQQHIGGFSLRRILVVTQFTVSQMLIIGLIVIANKTVMPGPSTSGFRKDGVVMLARSRDGQCQNEYLADKNGGHRRHRRHHPMRPGAGNRLEQFNKYYVMPIGQRTNPGRSMRNTATLNTSLLSSWASAGRRDEISFPADTTHEALVNEVFMGKVGVRNPDEILGKTIIVDGQKGIVIVGVVRDFHNKSLRSGIEPIAILPERNHYYSCAARINLANISTILPAYEKIWNQTYPDFVYSHQFLDERIDRFYRQDTMTFRLVEGFQGLPFSSVASAYTEWSLLWQSKRQKRSGSERYSAPASEHPLAFRQGIQPPAAGRFPYRRPRRGMGHGAAGCKALNTVSCSLGRSS